MVDVEVPIEDYGLDLHCSLMLEDYRAMQNVYEVIQDIVVRQLKGCLSDNNILVTAVESRIKTEKSLVGKLILKGHKYKTLEDLTDIVGARVITFYVDEVDKISALVESLFDIDWENSVDKRKLLGKDTFGYASLHYICRIPKRVYYDEKMPMVNEIRFEIQMRTTLQHVWANMNHDTGYKSGIGIPSEYNRALVRLAGLLELADDEFCRLRNSLIDYRRKVEQLVKNGSFDEVELNGDTFRSYMSADPFAALNRKIADINHAEIQQVNSLYYLKPLLKMGIKTLGDLENMKLKYSEAAYQLALHQMSGTDLDIMASTLGLQDLCYVYIVDNGHGEAGLEKFLEVINGPSPYNVESARRIFARVMRLPIMINKFKNNG